MINGKSDCVGRLRGSSNATVSTVAAFRPIRGLSGVRPQAESPEPIRPAGGHRGSGLASHTHHRFTHTNAGLAGWTQIALSCVKPDEDASGHFCPRERPLRQVDVGKIAAGSGAIRFAQSGRFCPALRAIVAVDCVPLTVSRARVSTAPPGPYSSGSVVNSSG